MAVRLPNNPTEADFETFHKLESEGIETTQVTETVSMASVEGHTPVLSSVKGADFTKYPFYGRFEFQPANAKLDENSAAVSNELLSRLKITTADTIRIGAHEFHIAAKIISEPDKMTTGFTLGPRIFLTREGLQNAGIISDVSRANERVLLKLPENRDIAALRTNLESTFGRRARITDYTETNPALTRALDRATRFLSMVSLIALIVGGLGVGATMQSHIRQKMTSIAFMKCIGGRSADILRIYFVQASCLGLTGSILGALLGAFAQSAFAKLLATYFDVRITPVWPVIAVMKGVTAGLLTTVLFALPALLAIRSVRPAFLLRKDFSGESGSGFNKSNSASLIASGGTIAGLWGIAIWISGSLVYASVFAGGLIAAILIIGGVGVLLLRFLKIISTRSMVRRSPAIRHGIANLYRPGAHAIAILASIAIGVMFTMSVYSVQHSILDEIRSTSPPDAPNIFLINVTENEHEGIDRLIQTDPAVVGRNPLTISASAQLVSVDEMPLEQLPSTAVARRFLESPVTLTVSRDLPSGSKILKGQWWNETPAEPLVSVVDSAAETLGIHVGSTLEWTTTGTERASIRARVASIRQSNGVRLANNGTFVLSPGALDGTAMLYFGTIRVVPAEIGAFQTRVFEKFPTVAVVSLAEILQMVQDIVDRAGMVVRFVAGFAIFGGLIVLASSVVGTRYRRIREVAILKTVGANRRTLVRIFSTEFATIGIVAGFLGSALGTGMSAILISKLLDTPYHFTWIPAVVATAITAVLTITAGWIASYGVLGQKPLEILRNVDG